MDGSSLAAIIRPSQPTQGSMRFDRRIPNANTKSSSANLFEAIQEFDWCSVPWTNSFVRIRFSRTIERSSRQVNFVDQSRLLSA
jgi:hypothetical protein